MRPFCPSAAAKLGKSDVKSKKKCGFIFEYHELHEFLYFYSTSKDTNDTNKWISQFHNFTILRFNGFAEISGSLIKKLIKDKRCSLGTKIHREIVNSVKS